LQVALTAYCQYKDALYIESVMRPILRQDEPPKWWEKLFSKFREAEFHFAIQPMVWWQSLVVAVNKRYKALDLSLLSGIPMHRLKVCLNSGERPD
jgi:hypothetical protein